LWFSEVKAETRPSADIQAYQEGAEAADVSMHQEADQPPQRDQHHSQGHHKEA
jgi:hypothetical protein